jgi:hypothetical protein
MAPAGSGVTVGIDTHKDVHVAAAFTSDLGRPLGHLQVPTTPTGYRQLLDWAAGLGDPVRFGIEGTGSFGIGLTRDRRSGPRAEPAHAASRATAV